MHGAAVMWDSARHSRILAMCYGVTAQQPKPQMQQARHLWNSFMLDENLQAIGLRLYGVLLSWV